MRYGSLRTSRNSRVQRLHADEPPQPLDQVQVRRVARQYNNSIFNEAPVPVPRRISGSGVVQHQCDRQPEPPSPPIAAECRPIGIDVASCHADRRASPRPAPPGLVPLAARAALTNSLATHTAAQEGAKTKWPRPEVDLLRPSRPAPSFSFFPGTRPALGVLLDRLLGRHGMAGLRQHSPAYP